MSWTCPSDKLPEARRIVDAMFWTAPEEHIVAALHQLRIFTVGRDGETRDERSASVEMRSWAHEMARFPADIVICVIQDWKHRSKFWPTWKELYDLIQAAMSRRRWMRHTIERLEREAPQLGLAPESDEHRAAVVEKAFREILGRNTVDNVRGSRTVYTGQRDDAGTDYPERLKADAALEALRERMVNEKLSFSSPELIARHARKEDE